MNPKEAFDTLLKTATYELEKRQQAGAVYFASVDTVHIREAVDRVERIQSLIQALHQLQGQWKQMFPEPL